MLFLIAILGRWERAGNVTDIHRITFGLVLAGAAYLVLAAATALTGGGKVPLAPEILFFLLIDFSIPWVDTVILTMISRDAPAGIVSTMLGVYYLATAIGNFLNGWLGGFSDKMSFPAFWTMHAAIYGVLLVLMLAGGGALARMLATAKPKPIAAQA